MELQYVKVHQYDTPKTCQYNDGCCCNTYQRSGCYRCGWNPKVVEKRMEKLMGKGCK